MIDTESIKEDRGKVNKKTGDGQKPSPAGGLSVFLDDGEPDLTIVRIVDHLVPILEGPVDNADLRGLPQHIARGGQPLGDGLPTKIVHKTHGELAALRLANEIGPGGDGQVFVPLGELAQTLVEILQRPMGQLRPSAGSARNAETRSSLANEEKTC